MLNLTVDKTNCEINSDGVLIFTGKINEPSNIIIPGIMDGKLIKGIGFRAFANLENIASIKIPDTVRKIDTEAFCGCSKLESINISNSSKLKYIKNSAFLNCCSLKEIFLPCNLKEIGSMAFCDCRSLKKIIIPKDIETINDYVFCNCINLTDVNLPNCLTTIGEQAFTNCQRLKIIKFPPYVQNIYWNVFNCCNDIQIFFEGDEFALLGLRQNNCIDKEFARNNIRIYSIHKIDKCFEDKRYNDISNYVTSYDLLLYVMARYDSEIKNATDLNEKIFLLNHREIEERCSKFIDPNIFKTIANER